MERKLRFLVPANFNVEEVANYYFKCAGLKENDLLFIIHSLLDARIKQRKDMEKTDTPFAKLSSTRLDEVVHNYSDYINFLLRQEVWECDGYYIKGEKSKGYKFSSQFSGVGTKYITVEDDNLAARIEKGKEKRNEFFTNSTLGYEYLTKWWDTGKLDIELKGAYEWIEADKQAKLIQWRGIPDKELGRQKIKSAIDTASDFKTLVQNFKYRCGSPYFKGDGHRFYTSMSTMKKGLRNYLSYDGKKLVGVDIKNSHPFLSLVLFNQSFWSEPTSKKELNLGILSEKIRKEIIKDRRDNIIMLLNQLTDFHMFSSFHKYKELVRSGEFYPYVMKTFAKQFPDKFKDKKETKQSIMMILYDRPAHAGYKLYKAFGKEFPFPYRLFTEIKGEDYRHLPRILQRIESFLLIDECCKRIAEDYPDVFITTLHDSVITTVGNEYIVQQFIDKVFKEWLGFTPLVKFEYDWNEDTPSRILAAA